MTALRVCFSMPFNAHFFYSIEVDFANTRCRMFCNQISGQCHVLMCDSGSLRRFRIRRGIEVQNLANLLLDIVSFIQIKFGNLT